MYWTAATVPLSLSSLSLSLSPSYQCRLSCLSVGNWLCVCVGLKNCGKWGIKVSFCVLLYLFGGTELWKLKAKLAAVVALWFVCPGGNPPFRCTLYRLFETFCPILNLDHSFARALNEHCYRDLPFSVFFLFLSSKAVFDFVVLCSPSFCFSCSLIKTDWPKSTFTFPEAVFVWFKLGCGEDFGLGESPPSSP